MAVWNLETSNISWEDGKIVRPFAGVGHWTKGHEDRVVDDEVVG